MLQAAWEEVSRKVIPVGVLNVDSLRCSDSCSRTLKNISERKGLTSYEALKLRVQ